MKVKIHDIIRKDSRERNEVHDEAMRGESSAPDLSSNPDRTIGRQAGSNRAIGPPGLLSG